MKSIFRVFKVDNSVPLNILNLLRMRIFYLEVYLINLTSIYCLNLNENIPSRFYDEPRSIEKDLRKT